MGRGSLLAVFAVLVMAACGDDDDATDVADPGGSTTTDQPIDGASEEGSDSGSDPDEGGAGPGGLEAGTARVTIGDMTWEAVADQCLDFGTSLGFAGGVTDDPETRISLDAVTDDPSANSASVDLGDEAFWRAGPDFLTLGATTPEVTAEDGYGTGTATFVDVNSVETVTAEGTYEFFCG